MSPRNPHPLSELTQVIERTAAAVAEAFKGLLWPVDSLRNWADERLDRAMTCPDCGHGSAVDPVVRAEQAENCDCTDDYCECNDAAVTGEPPR